MASMIGVVGSTDQHPIDRYQRILGRELELGSTPAVEDRHDLRHRHGRPCGKRARRLRRACSDRPGLAGRLRRLRRRNGSRCRLTSAPALWTGVAAASGGGGVKAASESGTARPPPYRTATAPTAARTRSAASLAGTTSLARLHVGIGPVEIVRPCCAVVTGSLKATLATTARAPAAKDASSGVRLSGAFSKYRRRKAVTFSPSAVETGGLARGSSRRI